MSQLFPLLSVYVVVSVLVFVITLAATENNPKSPPALVVSVTLLWPLYAAALAVAGLLMAAIYFCKWVHRVASYLGGVYAA